MRFVRSPAATLKKVGSGAAVYVAGRRAIHVLNPTAHLLVDYLAEPASSDELARALEMATDGGGDAIRADLEAALDELLEQGIIERCDG